MADLSPYNFHTHSIKEVWAAVISVLLLATGWKYLKEFIAFVLMQLYDLLVLKNPAKL